MESAACEHSVEARRVAQHDLLEARQVEVAAVHLDQGGRPVAGEEVLEFAILPGPRQSEPILVEGQRALVVPRPDRLAGGLSQEFEVFASFVHSREL